MSKIDMMKSMTQDANNTEYKDEQTRMEARLMVLSLQEESRIKNSQEMIQLMKKLQSSISQSAGQVESAARLVKDHPTEIIAQYTARMEQCLAQCEAAARRTKANHDAISSLIKKLNESYLLVFAAIVATFAGGMTAATATYVHFYK